MPVSPFGYPGKSHPFINFNQLSIKLILICSYFLRIRSNFSERSTL